MLIINILSIAKTQIIYKSDDYDAAINVIKKDYTHLIKSYPNIFSKMMPLNNY
ncbi:hypothetical protein AwWohl_05610 [Gammaproteobacteria bacterium]|nr:hypothetical protein AwWohl_05610 [Gammaproteobacteria bacterium]